MFQLMTSFCVSMEMHALALYILRFGAQGLIFLADFCRSLNLLLPFLLCNKFLNMPGRGKKTTKRGLVKNPSFRRERGSSSESEPEMPAPARADEDVHNDEILDLHDQLEQGELIDESDSKGEVPLARGVQRVIGAQAPGAQVVTCDENTGLNRELLDLVASLQSQQSEMAARMKEMSGQLEKEVAPYVWKKEGLRLQNEIAASALSKLENALAAFELQHFNRVRVNINASASILCKRMKELRIADTSESGWETVNAYKANPIAGDSDDDKHLQREEKVAKERVAAKARKSKFNGRGRFYRRPYWNRDNADNQHDFPYRNNGSGKSQDQQQ